MEKEKRRMKRKWSAEGVKSHWSKTKTKRRKKCWAQMSLGISLGLVLGFIMESNLFVPGGNNGNDTFCKMGSEVGPSSVSKKIEPTEFRDPQKIINLEKLNWTRHNSQENLVLVGVMTAQKYLSSRAVAVYETWGRELPGRIAFFTSEMSSVPESRKDLPLIRLKKVDDSYPPQKKSFMMLQYMWENYGDRFEWFIRADDDVYIRPDRLGDFLRAVDSRKALFIGQAGRGNQEEFGLLSLEFDENFCMGGPGIILSRETLRRIAPHIKYCLKNLYTTHEDVELGRCVRKFANISCTWSYEMQTILYHNSSGYEAFTGNLKQKEVNRAITLHPVKQHQYMYRLHSHMRQLKIQKLERDIMLLQRDFKKALLQLSASERIELEKQLKSNKFDENYMGDVDVTGLEPSILKLQNKTKEGVLHWDFIQKSLYSAGNLNPRRRIEVPYKEGVEDVITEFMEMTNQFSRQRGRTIDYQDLLYGYYRVDPLHGVDYALDMLLKYKKYRGRKMTVPVRRHAYLQQQFTGIEVREIIKRNDLTEKRTSDANIKVLKNVIGESLIKLNRGFSDRVSSRKEMRLEKIINFILPLSGRYETFLRFIKNYEEVCLVNDRFTALVIILFQSKGGGNGISTETKVEEHIEKLKMKYSQSSLKVIPVRDRFARAMALEIGTSYCKDDESNILFYIDVDMVFTKETLRRIRQNTIRGHQVYFPIVYSEFDPSIVYGTSMLGNSSLNHFVISPDTGYWRHFGFGIASAYKKDIQIVGGFDTSIRGWGKEDVDLYDKFVAVSSNLTIFRAIDPTLIHIFHLVDCDPNLEINQLKMCRGTRKDTYGNVNQLARCIYGSSRAMNAALHRKRKFQS